MFSSQLWSVLSLLLVLAPLGRGLPLQRRVQERESVSRRGAGRGFEIPIVRKRTGRVRRRNDAVGEAELGDLVDFQYTVGLTLGSTSTSAHLDTGSSDLWIISDACTGGTCAKSNGTRYSTATANNTGAGVTLRYGDSTTGTQATGPIVKDTATIAGISVPQQVFAAVNFTDNTIVSSAVDAAGIFGLGFPSESLVQGAIVNVQSNNPSTTDDFIDSIPDNGPLLSRIAMSGDVDQPMFTISLQRDTIEIGGNDGALTVGRLPDGVDNSSLTWVPVKLYSPAVGGIQPPTFAPNEVYPLRWEVELDAVFLDGQQLADTTQTGSLTGNSLSALIDTGNSLMRGPTDVVDNILSTISRAYAKNPTADPTFSCSTPHTLAFQIGGKTFPIDPLDFLRQASTPAPNDCTASNIVATDPPSVGATFSWSLGDPFFKSTLVAFYYGNLTHPSVDPPRIGFMSTVTSDTTAELSQAIADAQTEGGLFESTLEVAPSASAAVTTVNPTDTVDAAEATASSASASPSDAATAVTASAEASASSTSSNTASSSQQTSSATITRTTRTGAWMVILAVLSMLSCTF
ncbi:acid protease [Punctularia strigosozonata HHB-11173 SS5]|uniref:acid protease n=1 Tax=Punctularia strigosozonata (strain HHB-11173) TaxID=741275 RepID=UPI0004417C19|nr:acid protease [Punctularia strigosozonata HHB-11173 SS5]EIN13008.1 acid protease [Punctularia strigosozonata HHB-11173 SS5]